MYGDEEDVGYHTITRKAETYRGSRRRMSMKDAVIAPSSVIAAHSIVVVVVDDAHLLVQPRLS